MMEEWWRLEDAREDPSAEGLRNAARMMFLFWVIVGFIGAVVWVILN
jgi:hypothetical protein